MTTIAITGANGYLASLIQKQNHETFTFLPITRKDVDYEDLAALNKFFEKQTFDILIHTAARTQTADCEAHPFETKKVNTDSAIELAKICKKKNARFIFLSTEQVFNDNAVGPYSESDSPKSASIYGQQKLAVETFLRTFDCDYLILRLSWMMGLSYPEVSASPNILKQVISAFLYQQPTSFPVHEVRGLTYAKKFADQLEKILQLPTGIYHFSSTNSLSTYAFATFIAKELGFDEKLCRKYVLPDEERYAQAPRDLRLATEKIKSHGLSLSSSQNDVIECLKDFGWQ